MDAYKSKTFSRRTQEGTARGTDSFLEREQTERTENRNRNEFLRIGGTRNGILLETDGKKKKKRRTVSGGRPGWFSNGRYRSPRPGGRPLSPRPSTGVHSGTHLDGVGGHDFAVQFLGQPDAELRLARARAPDDGEQRAAVESRVHVRRAAVGARRDGGRRDRGSPGGATAAVAFHKSRENPSRAEHDITPKRGARRDDGIALSRRPGRYHAEPLLLPRPSGSAAAAAQLCCRRGCQDVQQSPPPFPRARARRFVGHRVRLAACAAAAAAERNVFYRIIFSRRPRPRVVHVFLLFKSHRAEVAALRLCGGHRNDFFIFFYIFFIKGRRGFHSRVYLVALLPNVCWDVQVILSMATYARAASRRGAQRFLIGEGGLKKNCSLVKHTIMIMGSRKTGVVPGFRLSVPQNVFGTPQ